jgi:hypothetical protein
MGFLDSTKQKKKQANKQQTKLYEIPVVHHTMPERPMFSPARTCWLRDSQVEGISPLHLEKIGEDGGERGIGRKKLKSSKRVLEEYLRCRSPTLNSKRNKNKN